MKKSYISNISGCVSQVSSTKATARTSSSPSSPQSSEASWVTGGGAASLVRAVTGSLTEISCSHLQLQPADLTAVFTWGILTTSVGYSPREMSQVSQSSGLTFLIQEHMHSHIIKSFFVQLFQLLKEHLTAVLDITGILYLNETAVAQRQEVKDEPKHCLGISFYDFIHFPF